jgi:hypothetical protein
MPIRVSCQCGQSLSVPDEMAGKAGKCPKCKQILKVPANGVATAPKQAKPQAAKAPATAAAAPQAPAVPAPSNALPAFPGGSLAGLFEEAGITKKEGIFCPSCEAPVANGSVICVKCGFHMTEGRNLEAHQSTTKKKFGIKALNEAAEMMEREKDTESRLLGAGAPWWIMLSALVGLVVFISGLAIKMDASTSGEKSGNAILRRIQDAGYDAVLAASFGAAMILVANFAQLVVLITAFKESLKQGFLCLFAPFYITYYMFSRIKSKRLMKPVIILFVTAILGSIALFYGLRRI